MAKRVRSIACRCACAVDCWRTTTTMSHVARARPIAVRTANRRTRRGPRSVPGAPRRRRRPITAAEAQAEAARTSHREAQPRRSSRRLWPPRRHLPTAATPQRTHPRRRRRPRRAGRRSLRRPAGRRPPRWARAPAPAEWARAARAPAPGSPPARGRRLGPPPVGTEAGASPSGPELPAAFATAALDVPIRGGAAVSPSAGRRPGTRRLLAAPSRRATSRLPRLGFGSQRQQRRERTLDGCGQRHREPAERQERDRQQEHARDERELAPREPGGRRHRRPVRGERGRGRAARSRTAEVSARAGTTSRRRGLRSWADAEAMDGHAPGARCRESTR